VTFAKAKVEMAVQIVQRFVLARLRNRRFFSLTELNAAIREAVADLHEGAIISAAEAKGSLGSQCHPRPASHSWDIGRLCSE
jgi:hypothetical protein